MSRLNVVQGKLTMELTENWGQRREYGPRVIEWGCTCGNLVRGEHVVSEAWGESQRRSIAFTTTVSRQRVVRISTSNT